MPGRKRYGRPRLTRPSMGRRHGLKMAEDRVSDTVDLTRGAVRPSASRTVRALINYLEDDTPDSVWYAADSWRSHMPLRMETMEIEDVRQIRGAFSLDREGIFLADAPSSVLSLIHISEPTRQAEISYAVFCLKKKK